MITSGRRNLGSSSISYASIAGDPSSGSSTDENATDPLSLITRPNGAIHSARLAALQICLCSTMHAIRTPINSGNQTTDQAAYVTSSVRGVLCDAGDPDVQPQHNIS